MFCEIMVGLIAVNYSNLQFPGISHVQSNGLEADYCHAKANQNFLTQRGYQCALLHK